MKKILKKLLLLSVMASAGAGNAAGAHSAHEEHEETSGLAGTGHIMIEIGYRYSALYFAAQQKRWEFAAYQLDEIEEALERLAYLKPKHASNIEHFQNVVVGDMEKALSVKDQESFSSSFEKIRAECMACHVKSGVGFILLPVPGRHFSPVLE